MTAPGAGGLTVKLSDMVAAARRRGVRLWLDSGQLRYSAPKGILSADEIARLRDCKNDLIALLDQEMLPALESVAVEHGGSPRHVPLTYAQLARWHTYRSGERRPMRQVASATRFLGTLNAKWLQQCLEALARRHSALRTQITMLNEEPIQEVLDHTRCELQHTDLAALDPLIRQTEIEKIAGRVILQPMDLTRDSLWSAHLIKLSDDEHVLIIAMEHLISDGYSMGVFVRDLIAAYRQAEEGTIPRPSPYPAVDSQALPFSAYAVRQKKTEAAWLEQHRPYWRRHLFGCPRLCFPPDKAAPYEQGCGWGVASVRMSNSLKRALQEWSQRRGATVVMGALTAYAALVLRWCHAGQSIIQFQSDGRDSSEVENTIGFFASVLYLRVRLLPGDRFGDLLARIKEEYCSAYERADFSYMAAQSEPPQFTRNTTFNWVPKPPEEQCRRSDARADQPSVSSILLPHVTFPALELDQEPGLLLCETDEGVICSVQFPRNRFSDAAMEHFARSYLRLTETMVRQTDCRLSADDLHLGSEIHAHSSLNDPGVT